MAKTVILMMDSFGIGGAKDAAAFGDAGANTFLHIAQNYPEFGGNGLSLPNLETLGLANAGELASGVRAPLVSGLAKMTLAGRCKYGCMEEISAGKDTISGHWEMAGVPVRQDFGHFPLEYPSFPAEMVARICERAGIPGILGNKAASGTVIIQELGEEHLASGKPIFYTSADSNLQIAAHEEKFGLERLYKLCEIAFEEVKPYRIARVIALPFAGEKNGAFVRTKNRHDYALNPPAPTILDKAKAAGLSGGVCSPLEAALVKEACGQDFLTVTPGIRFADGDVGDQVRVMTPAKARLGGSDYIVVGRPITAAADPVAAYERCVKEFLGE